MVKVVFGALLLAVVGAAVYGGASLALLTALLGAPAACGVMALLGLLEPLWCPHPFAYVYTNRLTHHECRRCGAHWRVPCHEHQDLDCKKCYPRIWTPGPYSKIARLWLWLDD